MAMAETQTKSSRWDGLELHVKFGSQAYLDKPGSDADNATMASLAIGFRPSDRSFVGVSYATASYEYFYVGRGRRKPLAALTIGNTSYKWVESFLLHYQYRLRSGREFQPYLDAGLGVTDSMLEYDDGAKGAFTVALGALWRFDDRWAATLESRGVYWSQDNTYVNDDRAITTGSSQFTLGIAYSR